MLHSLLEVLQNFIYLNSYDFFIIYTFLPCMALFDRFFKKQITENFFYGNEMCQYFQKCVFY